MSRLLGYKVTREKRFQAGEGRCVFRVQLDQPLRSVAFRFAFEDELNKSQPDVSISVDTGNAVG